MNQIRQITLDALRGMCFKNNADEVMHWVPFQLEIADCILNRSAPDGRKRVQVIASTQAGKSDVVGAALDIRATTKPEKWAIIAGTKEKARIIMEYAANYILNHPLLKTQLNAEGLERLRMKKSADRLTFKRKGEIRVFSAEATRVNETSKALMGFGAPNIIEDESALIPDQLQATVMRMLGGHKDNFLMKIGNPFNNNHFKRTWENGRYYQIFCDYKRALREGRYTEDFINEMREEAMFDILYECKFPDEGMVEPGNWIPLITESELERCLVDDEQPVGEVRLGNDIAGGGRNFSATIGRAYNMAEVIMKRNVKDTMILTGIISNLATRLKVKNQNIMSDGVGVGRGLSDRLSETRPGAVTVMGSHKPSDEVHFVNLRAEMYWRAREWLLRGGKLIRHPDWKQLLQIRYKVVDSSGKIRIMSKEEMLKRGIDSPDVADGFSLTFARPEEAMATPQQQAQLQQYEVADTDSDPDSLDPYDD